MEKIWHISPAIRFCTLKNPMFFMVDRLMICETYYEIPLIRSSRDSAMDIITRARRIYTGFSFRITDLRGRSGPEWWVQGQCGINICPKAPRSSQ